MTKNKHGIFLLHESAYSDKGWAAMRSLLDQEMPEHRRRRPGGGWWWVALLVVGTSAGWWWLRPDNATIPSGSKTSVPLPSTELPATAPVAQTAPALPEAPMAGSNRQTSAQRGVFFQKTSGKQPSTLPSEPVGGTSLSPVLLAKNGVVTPPVAPTLTVPEGATPPLAEARVEPTIAAEIQAQQAPRLLLLSSLPLRKAPLLTADLDLPEAPQVADNHLIKKGKRPRVISVGLTAGVIAGQVRDLPGMIGGVQIGIHPRRSRLGLSTGLTYRYQQLSGDNRPVVPLSYLSYLNATDNFRIQPDSLPDSWLQVAAFNRVLVPIDRVHRIEVPLMLSWRANHWCSLYAGAAFSRVYQVHTTERSLFTYDLNVLYVPNKKAAEELDAVVTSQLPAWENNWQLGTGFRPLKHFEINVFYRKTWRGRSPLADPAALFDRCYSCDNRFPAAESKTKRSLRPDSWQISTTFSF